MNRVLIILAILTCFVEFSFAQISQGGTPYSFQNKTQGEIPVLQMYEFDVSAQRAADDAMMENSGKPLRFAKAFDIDADLTNSGLWEKLPNGDNLWRIKIVSKGAYSLNIIFDNFKLPEGALVFVYSADKQTVLGAFTYKNNKKSNILPIGIIAGDEIIVEYFEPKKVDFSGELRIGRVGHDYRGIVSKLSKDGQFGASGECNVDINCDEGDDWQDEKHAICRMVIDSYDLCTGALIANMRKDDTPYFLTANHCIDSESDAEKTVFYFNYESPSCNGPDGSVSQTISGAELRATTTNLDFALVELSSDPPSSYNPYFLGWNKSDQPSTGVTCIHHPWGDVKKISIDNDAIELVSYEIDYNSNSHWLVLRWDVGTTEGGSSGSPLLDSNGRIIGDLTGGYATCDDPVNDYYARLYNSWEDYVNPSQQLKKWLDPDNTGAITMNGYNPENQVEEPTGCISIANIDDTDTPSLYIAEDNTGNDFGYITGNNGYGDIAKAEYYSTTTYGERTVIDGMYVYFAIAKGRSQPIKFAILDDDNGVPGDVIATSYVNLPTISQDVQNEDYTFIDFDPYVTIPGAFYATVYLPQGSGDTLAIVSNASEEASVNTAWELFSDETTWAAFDSENSWGLKLNIDIRPLICFLGTGISELNRLDESLVQIYPNPNNGQFTVDLSLINNQKYTLQVYSSFGSLVKSITYEQQNCVEEIDLSGNAPGIYLMHIQLNNGQRIVKKIVIN